MFKQSLLLLAGAMLVTACGGKKDAQEAVNAVPKYELMSVKKVDTQVTYSFPAMLEGCMDVDVFPQAEGRITGIFFETGGIVRKGQKLVTVESSKCQQEVMTCQANVKAAEAVVSSARLKLDSQKKLFEKKIVSEFVYRTAENDYQTALAQLSQAKAQLSIARTNLEHCTVTSPIGGIANGKPYKVGSLVSPGIQKPLTTVSDQSSITAKFSIPENAFADVISEHNLTNTPDGFRAKDGKKLDDYVQFDLLTSNGQRYAHKGTFITMSGIVDNQTGTAMCFVKFPNPEGVLRSGNSATVVFPCMAKGVFVIPQSACKKLQDKYLLYRVDKNNQAESVLVDVYPTDDGKSYIVTDGRLKEGDVILVSGVSRVAEGSLLR